MKKPLELRKLLLAATLLLCCLSTAFAADEPGVEKKKTYSKSYPLSASEKINLTNQFGEMKVTTWNKPEIKVEVSITVKASTEELAQRLLDNIDITDAKGSDGVSFKTEFNNKKNNERHGKNESTSMQINYEVTMPAGNPTHIENQFGKTFLPDLSGPSEVIQKFGDLTAGKLSNSKELTVEFGSVIAESVHDGKVTIKFSKAEIKELSGAIKADLEHSGKVKFALNNNTSEFTLNNQFSEVELNVPNNFSGDFDIHTNFGDFHNNTSLNIKQKAEDDDDHGPKFDKDYSGKTGSGACKVKMKLNFGSVKLI